MRRILKTAFAFIVLATGVAVFVSLHRVTIVGRITDVSGAPIAGAEIKGTSCMIMYPGIPGGSFRKYIATSGKDGRYKLRGNTWIFKYRSMETTYHLQASAGNYCRVHSRINTKLLGSNRFDFQLGSGAELQGRTVDSQNRPIPDCPYFILSSDRETDPQYTRSLPDQGFSEAWDGSHAFKTDGDGAFLLNGIPPDTYQLYIGQGAKFVPSTNSPFQVEAGQKLSGIDFVVFAPEDKAKLTAKVVGADGNPIPGFQIAMIKNVRADGVIVGMFKPEADGMPPGEFHVDGLDPGRVELLIGAPGHTQNRFKVPLAAGQTVEETFALTEGGTITGTMKPFIDTSQSSVGYVVPGFRVKHTCLVHNDGSYFVDRVPPQKYLLTAENRDKCGGAVRQESAWVEVESGRTLTIDFNLEGTATVQGRLDLPPNSTCAVLVRDRQAPDVTDWEDSTKHLEGTHGSVLIHDAASYSIPGLPAGEFKVTAVWLEYAPKSDNPPIQRPAPKVARVTSQEVVLKAGETVQADFI